MNRLTLSSNLMKQGVRSASCERLIQYSVRCYASTNTSQPRDQGFNMKDTMNPETKVKGLWSRLKGWVSTKETGQRQETGRTNEAKPGEPPTIQDLSQDVVRMRMAPKPDKTIVDKIAQKATAGVKKVSETTTKSQQDFGSKRDYMTSAACLRYVGEGYDEQQRKLGRPISPHMTIYRPQITWTLSLMHRFTGIVTTTLLYSLGIGNLFMSQQFPHYVQMISDLHVPGVVIVTFKFLLAWCLTYHTANGIRHLAWDAGYGFPMPVVFKTGVAVLVISTLAAIYLASI